MKPTERAMSRRSFFSRVGDGLHGAALASLLGADLYSAQPASAAATRVTDFQPRQPHFEPKATSVIHLFMNGGPSQVDLFDPKPILEKYAGKEAPRDIQNQLENPQQAGGFLPSPYKFAKHGEC